MLARILRLLPTPTIEGYEHPELVSEIFKKTLAAEPAESWPEIRGTKSVLDFGGACGIHYKAAHREAPNIRWAVVETPAMVREASKLATDHLHFFESIEAAAAWLGDVDLIYSSGALQYTPSPIETVERLAGIGAAKMQWRRLFLSDHGISERQRSMMIENGPSFRFSTKAVVYERKSLSRLEFESAHRGYRIEAGGPDWFDFVR
jgi:putative methyltransferase (TIGR04325 family)